MIDTTPVTERFAHGEPAQSLLLAEFRFGWQSAADRLSVTAQCLFAIYPDNRIWRDDKEIRQPHWRCEIQLAMTLKRVDVERSFARMERGLESEARFQSPPTIRKRYSLLLADALSRQSLCVPGGSRQ